MQFIALMTTKQIGEYIKVRRDLLRLQQKDLSELSGVSLRTIIQIENGKGNPSLTTLCKIAEVLGSEVELKVKVK